MQQNVDTCRQTDRRQFLRQGWAWLRLAALAALLYPLIQFLGFRVPRKPRDIKVYKEIKVGGFHMEPEFILFRDEKGTWAVSRTCTHLGCRVSFQEQEKLIVCPCHHSRFTSRGLRVGGPAKKNLPQFPVTAMAEGEGKGYVVHL
ncbi:MAG: ubiquinol-cytochrome c reductase iron-sulfur subunit [Desulfobacteraceae bacterium]|nr:ubiquinol-cytochrome c reductase iron-sulfur subunit [Desulfobacteraceae bacterium]